MNHYKVTAPVALQLNKSGWEESPITAGVSATSEGHAIDAYQKRVESLYVDNGKFLDADFYSSRNKYTITELNKPLSW